MRKSLTYLCCVALMWLSAAAVGQTDLVIVPAGDSITEGCCGSSTVDSYRKSFADLMDANQCGFEMRGSQLATANNSNFQVPHEGYAGWWAFHFINGTNPNGPRAIALTVNVERPDVILLHVGSNDLNGTGPSAPVSVDTALDNIRRVVNRINSESDALGIPRPTVLLARPIPWFAESQDDDGDGVGENPDILTDIEELGDKIAIAITSGFPDSVGSATREPVLSNLYDVDAFSGFTQQMMQSDLIHPNLSGEQFLAGRFFQGMVDAGLCTFSTNQCNGMPVTVDIGNGDSPTSGADVILGTSGPDVINALAGDDTICGFGGNDIINAGGGNDWIDAGPGNDRVLASAGDDIVFGGPGDDEILAGSGDDDVEGEEGDDTLFGQPGNDTLDGGDGVDAINGGGGSDMIFTGPGATVGTGKFVTGNVGNDTITGGPDADDLRGFNGLDTINGGGGDDVISGGDGRDTIDGGDGDDEIRGQNGVDLLSGGSGDDFVSGGNDADTINGGPGGDEIIGGPGNDILNGDGGSDDIEGGSGDDAMVGGSGGGDSCNGQSGTDTADASCETVVSVP